MCRFMGGIVAVVFVAMGGGGGGGSLGFISLFVLSDVLFRRFVLWAGLVVFQGCRFGFLCLIGMERFSFFCVGTGGKRAVIS